MQETGTINAEIRERISRGINRRLRRDGFIPAVVYGKGIDPIPITVKRTELKGILTRFGRSAIYNLNITGQEPWTVIVKEIQNHPVTEEITHADFQRISLTEKIKIEVPIKIIGRELVESKRLLVIQQLDDLTVRCLPTEVPKSIDVDVTAMEDGDVVTVADLKIPEGVEVEDDPEQIVISIIEAKEHAVEEEGTEESAESAETAVGEKEQAGS
ncbi:MAG TPA: 50S ribosomal protein L25 [Clostridiaceae bacterium]|nr:50S ribosomal protein L25 [Clostridiaceae bacterium]